MRFYSNVFSLGNRVFVRGYETTTRKRFAEIRYYKPTLYVPTKDITRHRNIRGAYLAEKPFNSIKDARNFLSDYKDIPNFEIYGYENFAGALTFEEFGADDFTFDEALVKIGYLDIEVASENGFPDPIDAKEEVLVISLKVRDLLLVFGLQEYQAKPGEQFFLCGNETELLTKFLKFWRMCDLDIVTGWNIEGFDLPYLFNRLTRLCGEDVAKTLSPYNTVRPAKSKNRLAKTKTIKIYGIEVIDYHSLYRKYGVREPLENFRLDTVADHEVKQKKLDYSQYGSLHKLYRSNYQLYVEYNIRDTLLVERLEKKLRLIQMVIFIAYKCRVNFEDVFSPIAMWDSLIYAHLRKRNIIIPVKHQDEKEGQYEGAHVKPPITGLHEWVMSYDAKALYPSTILTYNLGIDTIIDGEPQKFTVDDVLEGHIRNKDHSVALAANGYTFRKDKQSFLAEILTETIADRDRFKKAMLDAKRKYEETHDPAWKSEAEKNDVQQNSRKTLNNSCYGYLGSVWSRFFDIRIAEAITLSSQLTNRFFMKRINGWLNGKLGSNDVDYVITGDTDSSYVAFNPLVQKVCAGRSVQEIVTFLMKLDKEILAPKITGWLKELEDMMGFYENHLYMKREVIAGKGIWTAKKRYVMSIWANESVVYKYPRIKMTGVQAISSAVPTHCRKRIKTCVALILLKHEEKLQKYVGTYERKFKDLPFEEVAAPRGVNDIEKYQIGTSWGSATPIQVRASIIYNQAIKAHGLEHKYEAIRSGDKIKFAYLKMPNPTGQNVIACNTVLPPELGLHDFIDYETQFEKHFLGPLEPLVLAAGWETKKGTNLLSIFSAIDNFERPAAIDDEDDYLEVSAVDEFYSRAC